MSEITSNTINDSQKESSNYTMSKYLDLSLFITNSIKQELSRQIESLESKNVSYVRIQDDVLFHKFPGITKDIMNIAHKQLFQSLKKLGYKFHYYKWLGVTVVYSKIISVKCHRLVRILKFIEFNVSIIILIFLIFLLLHT